MLTIAGAELIQVPAVPYKNPNNYVKYSGRLAEALAKVGLGRVSTFRAPLHEHRPRTIPPKHPHRLAISEPLQTR
jgi:hypothetical protein